MIKVRCPICDQPVPGRTADWPDYPFCGPRCRLVDLGRWLGENYHPRRTGERRRRALSTSPQDDQVP